jgi:hypothetical protein
MADESPPQEQQPQEQQFYRQYLQSTGPDGSQTIREVVSPSLLDADAAAAAEKQAGYTFTGFVDPSKMAAVRSAPAPAPPPAEETPLLPSAVHPVSGAVPEGYSSAPPTPGPWEQWQAAMPDQVANPSSSPWLNMIPPALATAGPLALSIAQPEIGIPMWLASGALAAGGGGGGEAIREKLAGEPLSAKNIAEQGAVSGATDVGMSQVVEPYVLGPAAKFVTGKLGRVLTAAEDLGPTLTSEGTTVAAPAASAPPPPLRVVDLHPIDLATKSPETLQAGIQTLAKQATAEERPAIAAAWVATMRQRAANAGDPVTYMRAAYEALGEETQQALFGAQKGAYERMLNTAWSGAPGEMRDLIEGATAGGTLSAGGHYGARYLGIPALGLPTASGIRTAADLTAPFAARGMLVSPGAARFGARLSSFGGVAGPAAANLAAQSVAERARQAGLPTF